MCKIKGNLQCGFINSHSPKTKGRHIHANLPFFYFINSKLLYQAVIKFCRRCNLFGGNLLVNAVYHGSLFR